jgi:hypothetical protein
MRAALRDAKIAAAKAKHTAGTTPAQQRVARDAVRRLAGRHRRPTSASVIRLVGAVAAIASASDS